MKLESNMLFVCLMIGLSSSLNLRVGNIERDNVIFNAEFDEPKPNNWKIYKSDEVKGWKSNINQIEIGKGTIYNRAWPSNEYILELDPKKNAIVSQDMNLPAGLNCHLEIEYAARKSGNRGLESSSMNIKFNEEVNELIVPEDYNIHSFEADIVTVEGKNTIVLEARGKSDSYGMTVSKVSLKCPQLACGQEDSSSSEPEVVVD